jgi:hypothetical protein
VYEIVYEKGGEKDEDQGWTRYDCSDERQKAEPEAMRCRNRRLPARQMRLCELVASITLA